MTNNASGPARDAPRQFFLRASACEHHGFDIVNEFSSYPADELAGMREGAKAARAKARRSGKFLRI